MYASPFTCSEVGIYYKRKQESKKKDRNHAFDLVSDKGNDQEKKFLDKKISINVTCNHL